MAFLLQIQRRPATIQACLNHAKHYEAGPASNGGAVVSLVTPSLLTRFLFWKQKGDGSIGKSPKMAPSFRNFGANEI